MYRETDRERKAETKRELKGRETQRDVMYTA